MALSLFSAPFCAAATHKAKYSNLSPRHTVYSDSPTLHFTSQTKKQTTKRSKKKKKRNRQQNQKKKKFEHVQADAVPPPAVRPHLGRHKRALRAGHGLLDLPGLRLHGGQEEAAEVRDVVADMPAVRAQERHGRLRRRLRPEPGQDGGGHGERGEVGDGAGGGRLGLRDEVRRALRDTTSLPFLFPVYS